MDVILIGRECRMFESGMCLESELQGDQYCRVTAGRGIFASGRWPYMYNKPLRVFRTCEHVNGAETAFSLLELTSILYPNSGLVAVV